MRRLLDIPISCIQYLVNTAISKGFECTSFGFPCFEINTQKLIGCGFSPPGSQIFSLCESVFSLVWFNIWHEQLRGRKVWAHSFRDRLHCSGPEVKQNIITEGCGEGKLLSSQQPGRRAGGTVCARERPGTRYNSQRHTRCDLLLQPCSTCLELLPNNPFKFLIHLMNYYQMDYSIVEVRTFIIISLLNIHALPNTWGF